MAIIATFIGIDKHADFRIRDLMGARRDAVALWALFCDTLPDVQARKLIDAEATVAEIQQALDETFYAAGPDDTIILSFSGHGTRDHRLVAHDTTLDNLAATTIPMSDLANRFKRSQAKAVLCILDCCFSGGAPARVLEDSPMVRDPGSPLQELDPHAASPHTAVMKKCAILHPNARAGDQGRCFLGAASLSIRRTWMLRGTLHWDGSPRRPSPHISSLN